MRLPELLCAALSKVSTLQKRAHALELRCSLLQDTRSSALCNVSARASGLGPELLIAPLSPSAVCPWAPHANGRPQKVT